MIAEKASMIFGLSNANVSFYSKLPFFLANFVSVVQKNKIRVRNLFSACEQLASDWHFFTCYFTVHKMHTYVNFVSHGQTLLQQERKSYPHTCYLSLLIVIIRINELTTSQLVSSKFQVFLKNIHTYFKLFWKANFFISFESLIKSEKVKWYYIFFLSLK